MNRRDFCQQSALLSAIMALPGGASGKDAPEASEKDAGVREANEIAAEAGTAPGAERGPEIIDTNINLFEWPFRKLKYSDTGEFLGKLNRHHLSEAWAGSFEALFHKNMDLVNARLAETCKKQGKNIFMPVGSVNTSWPGWEEDLRRCHESYGMKGIRVYPIYQMIELDSPEFMQLVEMASGRGLFIQIVGDMEDSRHHHPLIEVRDISFDPVVEVAKRFPEARIQLLHWNRKVGKKLLEQIVRETHIVFDISRIEGAGELGGLITGDSWYGPDTAVPAERFLFGSHVPYFPLESALFKLFESPLSPEELNKIMRENASVFKNGKNSAVR